MTHSIELDGSKVEFFKIANKQMSFIYRQLLKHGGTEALMASEKFEEVRDIMFASIFVDGLCYKDKYDDICNEKGFNFEIMAFGAGIGHYLKKELAALQDLANGKSTPVKTAETKTETTTTG